RAPIHDIHCGMRAFRADLIPRLDLRCTGMEFASEMVIKARLRSARVTEIPITLWPDGRQGRRPHLRTFRDGWRHLRFFLLFSPRRLFLVPGFMLILLGLLAYGLAMPGIEIHGAKFDANTLLFGTLGILCGYQEIFFAIFATALA